MGASVIRSKTILDNVIRGVVRRRDEDGAALIEYALLVALIALVCIVGIAFLGESLDDHYSKVASGINGPS